MKKNTLILVLLACCGLMGCNGNANGTMNKASDTAADTVGKHTTYGKDTTYDSTMKIRDSVR